MVEIVLLLLFLMIITYDTYYFVIFLYQSHKKGKIQYNPDVSVVIPVFNNESTIQDCIASILNAHYKIREIIVVDDGSTDDTGPILDSYADERITVYHIPHAGKAAALNYGIERAAAEIVTVDGDTTLLPDTIPNLVRNLKTHDAVAGNLQVSNRKGFLGRCQCIEHVRVAMFRKVSLFFDRIDIVPGPLGAFKKEIFSQLAYGTSTVEDMELTQMLREKGYSIGYEQDAKAYTEMPGTTKQFLNQRLRWAQGNMELASRGVIPVTALLTGYMLAAADMTILMMSLWVNAPGILLFFFIFESCTMIVGTYEEAEPCFIESVFFPIFMLFLDFIYLITHVIAFISLCKS